MSTGYITNMTVVLQANAIVSFTAQKIKFSIKDFFSKCDQIRSFLWIWSHLLKSFLMENFLFCAVFVTVDERADLIPNVISYIGSTTLCVRWLYPQVNLGYEKYYKLLYIAY